ncbi:trypsin-like serine protease [Microbacterium sp. NPDC007973]|uniref:trypsin-like serine protease n=1 Tax=Microbacterium sp. NPDC007973 TaxID=3364182 RepID=UPI0036EB6FCD
MRRHRVATSRIRAALHRFFVVVLAVSVSVSLFAADPAAASQGNVLTAAPTCAYDLCGVTFATKGREYLASRPAPWSGMLAVSDADAARVGAQKALAFQDVGDGTVYIRDTWGRCLTSPGGDRVQFHECEFVPNERWYFQGQGQKGLFVIRHFASENGDHDDRCLDVNDGHPGISSRMHLYTCKNSSADWQVFSGSNVDSAQDQATRAALYDHASRYASEQCEKKENITCSYTPGSTAVPALTAPEMLAATAVNYSSQTLKDTITVKKTKSATVSWGFSQKLTIKIEANFFGFAKEEYALENAWSWNKATTDTTEISQAVDVQVPVNGRAWVAYAQLTTQVTGKIRFVAKDTGKAWTGESTVVLPTKNDGNKTSMMVVCDSLSTKPFCLKTAPAGIKRAADIAPLPTEAEWLVSVEGDDHACSGTAIDERWVVTAKHCPVATEVRYSGGDASQSETVSVDRVADAPQSDIRLLHLSEPHALRAYPTLDMSYDPKDGDVATAYTLGSPSAPERVSRTSTVTGGREGDLIGVRTDSMSGLAADSGGPVFVDGKFVGVASVADGSAPVMTFANLRSAAATIAPEIIESVTIEDGLVTVRMGENLFSSATRVMIWGDSSYVAETYAGTAYYSWWVDNGDGTVTVRASAPAGALVRVGISDGQPGWGASVDSVRVHDAVLDGVTPHASLTEDGHASVTLPDALVASSHRTMVYVNGRYVGETWNDTVYYMWRGSADGLSTLESTMPFAHGDVLEVRDAEGQPGWGADRYAVLRHTVL